MVKFALLYFLILGAVIVVMLLIMLARGWRPDIKQEKRAWKSASPIIWHFIFISCGMSGLAICKIAGMDNKHAISVGFVLFSLLEVAARLWSRRKPSKDIRKLDNELLSNLNDKPKQ